MKEIQHSKVIFLLVMILLSSATSLAQPYKENPNQSELVNSYNSFLAMRKVDSSNNNGTATKDSSTAYKHQNDSNNEKISRDSQIFSNQENELEHYNSFDNIKKDTTIVEKAFHTTHNADFEIQNHLPKDEEQSKFVQSAAMVIGGIALAGFGIAYWHHSNDISKSAAANNVNPTGVALVSILCIPAGISLFIYGMYSFSF
jgi:hypothetical protein